VLFTANSSSTTDRGSGEVAVIEASWGLGESVVQGLVTPDEYVVGAGGVVELRLGDKRTRIDRCPGGTVTTEVPDEARGRACLSDDQVERLRKLGQDVADDLGGPQDIEFAVEGDQIWLLQARPITADLAVDPREGAPAEPSTLGSGSSAARGPARPASPRHLRSQVSAEAGAYRSSGSGPAVNVQPPSETVAPCTAATGGPDLVLQGIAGSGGIAVGPARIVAGPEDFEKVAVGDILVCRFTDPAWTALFSVVAGVVTETGGRLSHAAIVARERRIPAVLGVSSVLSKVQDGHHLTIDGTTGTVRSHRPTQPPTA
jgi:pyruvate,water dikinase